MKLSKRDTLKLNLQHFAEEAEDKPETEPEEKDQEGVEGGEPEAPESDGEKRFTQAELDQIIADRLAREKKKSDEAKKKAEEKAEQERLEEQGEYKELLDKARQDLANKEAEIAARDRKDSINTKLAAKGLNGEDVARYSKYVERLVTNDEEIDQAVEEVYSDFVVAKQESYGDPSAGFGDSKKPEQLDDKDLGRSLYERIRK